MPIGLGVGHRKQIDPEDWTWQRVLEATGQGEQNEPLLPYTVNPDLTPGALPRATANGKVDTKNYSLTLTTRPFRNTRLNALLYPNILPV